MATRKTGPVKPPVIDLQAKKAAPKPAADKSAPFDKTSSAKSATPPGQKTSTASPKSKPANPPSSSSGATSSGASSRRSFGWSPLIGALSGALLAIIIMLALLASGLLQPLVSPAKTPQFIALRERVGANLEQINQNLSGLASLDEKVSALNDKTSGLGPRLDQQSSQLQAKIDDLAQRFDNVAGQYQSLSDTVANLQAAPNTTATPFDPSPLESKIALLAARIDAVAAGSSTGDAQKLSADLTAIRNQFASQRQQLALLKERLDGIEQPIASLNTLLDDTRQTLTQNQLEISQNASAISGLSTKLAALPPPPERQSIAPQALQLSLALMGMQSALDQGRPFADELASLVSLLPDLSVDKNLTDNAKAGLLRPDQLVDRFERKLPAMLAARPPGPDMGWQQAFWDRLKSLVALRPTAQAGLSGIDALIVEVENGVKHRDFAAAATAIAKLPAPMQAALGQLNSQIAAMGAMQNLLNQARIKALSEGTMLTQDKILTQDQKTGVDQ